MKNYMVILLIHPNQGILHSYQNSCFRLVEDVRKYQCYIVKQKKDYKVANILFTILYIKITSVLSHFSHVELFATPRTIAQQAPLSMGFSKQEYWSALPCPPPGDLPNPGIKPVSLMSPALADRFFTTRASWETLSLLFGIHRHIILFKILRQPARKKPA